VKACKKKFNAVGIIEIIAVETIEKTPQLRVIINSSAPKRVKFSLLEVLQMEERYVMKNIKMASWLHVMMMK
jgi:hypothetical protein